MTVGLSSVDIGADRDHRGEKQDEILGCPDHWWALSFNRRSDYVIFEHERHVTASSVGSVIRLLHESEKSRLPLRFIQTA